MCMVIYLSPNNVDYPFKRVISLPPPSCLARRSHTHGILACENIEPDVSPSCQCLRHLSRPRKRRLALVGYIHRVPADTATTSRRALRARLFFLISSLPPIQRPMPSLVRIGSVDVKLGEGQEENLMDYSLSKSAPTMETVEEVMQLFESGGQVRQTCFTFKSFVRCVVM